MGAAPALRYRVASDVGGTFTDLVYCEYDPVSGRTGQVHAVKTDTTPAQYEQGVLASIDKGGLAYDEIAAFAHGTTIVINALARILILATSQRAATP